MNISLPPELEKFVEKKVKSGRYTSNSEVVREGLRLLQDEELTQRVLRAKLEPTLKGDLRDLMKKS